MKQVKVFSNECVTWWDYTDPTKQALAELAARYRIHSTLVEDCLEPEHLPKIEESGDVTFIILRVFDAEAEHDAHTVRSLTRKVALFIGDNYLISLHRSDLPFLNSLKEKWANPDPKRQKAHPQRILTEIMIEAMETYEPFLNAAQEQVNELEEKVMEGIASHGVFPIAYHLKRRARLIKHILNLHLQIIDRIQADDPVDVPYLQDLKEFGQRQYFLTTEIAESLASLLNLQLSLESQRMTAASHHVNEVMRVLTMFSAIFLPLSFIAGVYGMNFQHMPELSNPLAYPITLLAMLLVAIAIVGWFYWRGWLRRFAPEAANLSKRYDSKVEKIH